LGCARRGLSFCSCPGILQRPPVPSTCASTARPVAIACLQRPALWRPACFLAARGAPTCAVRLPLVSLLLFLPLLQAEPMERHENPARNSWRKPRRQHPAEEGASGRQACISRPSTCPSLAAHRSPSPAWCSGHKAHETVIPDALDAHLTYCRPPDTAGSARHYHAITYRDATGDDSRRPSTASSSAPWLALQAHHYSIPNGPFQSRSLTALPRHEIETYEPPAATKMDPRLRFP
jgi:hypothetical protein